MLNKILIILLLLSSATYAGPLDILDARGDVSGRFGQEYFQAYGGIENNIVMSIQQGVRFQGAPFVEPYIGFNKAQATFIAGSGNTESVWGGVRLTDWLKPLVLGVEYRSTLVPNNPSIKSVVGYVSFHEGWDLTKGDR